MKRRQVIAVLCAGGALSMHSATGAARAPLDAGGACRVLQQAIARRDSLPESGPAPAGWFCDIAPSTDQSLYVIALRSGKSGLRGNLIGWYAVARASGTIHEWDVGKQRTGPVLKEHP